MRLPRADFFNNSLDFFDCRTTGGRYQELQLFDIGVSSGLLDPQIVDEEVLEVGVLDCNCSLSR